MPEEERDEGEVEQKRKDDEKEREEVKATMEKLEEDPPKDLKDWPSDKAKYETFGGGDGGGKPYDEGVAAKLGPSGVRHHEDGSVEVDGEKVDNPTTTRASRSPAGRPTRTRPRTAPRRASRVPGAQGQERGRGRGAQLRRREQRRRQRGQRVARD
jgi:hypothetical protein